MSAQTLLAWRGIIRFRNAKKKKIYFGNFYGMEECKFKIDRLYPIDIHAPAQLAIVVHKLGLRSRETGREW